MLINIQSNALKFTKSGGIVKIKTIYVQKASVRELEIDLQRAFVYEHDSFFNEIEDLQDEFTNKQRRDLCRPGEKDKVVISVLDTGVGIKKKD